MLRHAAQRGLLAIGAPLGSARELDRDLRAIVREYEIGVAGAQSARRLERQRGAAGTLTARLRNITAEAGLPQEVRLLFSDL